MSGHSDLAGWTPLLGICVEKRSPVGEALVAAPCRGPAASIVPRLGRLWTSPLSLSLASRLAPFAFLLPFLLSSLFWGRIWRGRYELVLVGQMSSKYYTWNFSYEKRRVLQLRPRGAMPCTASPEGKLVFRVNSSPFPLCEKYPAALEMATLDVHQLTQKFPLRAVLFCLWIFPWTSFCGLKKNYTLDTKSVITLMLGGRPWLPYLCYRYTPPGPFLSKYIPSNRLPSDLFIFLIFFPAPKPFCPPKPFSSQKFSPSPKLTLHQKTFPFQTLFTPPPKCSHHPNLFFNLFPFSTPLSLSPTTLASPKTFPTFYIHSPSQTLFSSLLENAFAIPNPLFLPPLSLSSQNICPSMNLANFSHPFLLSNPFHPNQLFS